MAAAEGRGARAATARGPGVTGGRAEGSGDGGGAESRKGSSQVAGVSKGRKPRRLGFSAVGFDSEWVPRRQLRGEESSSPRA